jgi:multidrug efflux pump subunit AcrA (membrane-fusion protein)
VPEIHQSFQRRTWVRRAIPAAAVAVLVVGGTVMVRNSASASPVDTYRTTTVTKGSVEQRLDLTGSVQRVNQVSQSFAVPGTVSSVSVAVGDTVTAGETLASLDPKPLNSAVLDADAALAQAKATLESDQSAATAATSTATAPPTQTVTPSTSPRVASPSGRSSASANQSLAAAQRGLTRAQSALAADLRQATDALAQCAPFFPSEPTASTPTDATNTVPTPSTTPTTTTSTPTADEIKACLDGLKSAPAQNQIQKVQLELTKSQANLTKTFTLAITSASKTAAASATTTRSTSTSQTATSQSSTSRSGSSQSTGGQSAGSGQSAATRVVSDQAAVTSAEASLSSAQTNLAAATLKSSIAGTVGSVTVVKGTSDQGESIVIVGAGAAEVTVNVPLASMATVRVGQTARVTPQGATSWVPGSVTSISLLPSATSTGTGSGTGGQSTAASTPTYPVVVRVPEAVPALASGSRAQASLLIGAVTGVLTVPNSALTPLGNGQALALTFNGGVATRALVKTGYAGPLTTQITSGLSAGQQVVLADLSTPLPTNTTNARRFGVGAGGAGGIGGAGLGGTGLGGAGFGGAGSGGGTFTGRSGFTPGG